jgi:hypothetical protein
MADLSESKRYYAHRMADEAGRPRLQTKTREQVALLDYAFSQTSGRPYTGELLALAFLSGLQVKQVTAWFLYRRKKCIKEENHLAVERTEFLGMRCRDASSTAVMLRGYNMDPRGYARSIIMWERCVRTGSLGLSEEALQRPRPYLKKYWNRMFPEGGEERSLLKVTEELEGSDDGSLANLTREERADMWEQSRVEARQFRLYKREIEAKAEAEAEAEAAAEA